MKFGGRLLFRVGWLGFCWVWSVGKWFSKVRDIGQPIIRRGAVEGQNGLARLASEGIQLDLMQSAEI